MTDCFQINQTEESITVTCESFTLEFDTSELGITSFRYETSGVQHECVNSGDIPPILFSPYFTLLGLTGDVLYPSGVFDFGVSAFPSHVQIDQKGWLRNPLIPNSTDFEYSVEWNLWPSGRIYCRMEMQNKSGGDLTFIEEAYRLNPANDADIRPGRDDIPDLNWFGFYSNNSGSGENDLSHDAIVVPWDSDLDSYAESGKSNRIFRTGHKWLEDEVIERCFLLALSVNDSYGDIEDLTGFQNRGDSVSSDYRNPDPVDGSTNAGDVLTGTIYGDGFDEEYGGYTISA